MEKVRDWAMEMDNHIGYAIDDGAKNVIDEDYIRRGLKEIDL